MTKAYEDPQFYSQGRANVTKAKTNIFNTHDVMMPVGVSNYTLREQVRTVPLTEPSVLPPNKDLKYIGHPIERLDGRSKVTGEAKFTADIQLPGMLYAKLVTAPVPHAKIISMDVSAAQNYPGVKANHRIHTGMVLGVAALCDSALEAPSEWPVVRYAGQPVVSITAISPDVAAEAAKLVTVEYGALPFVTNPQAACQIASPQVFPGRAEGIGLSNTGKCNQTVPQTGNVLGPAIYTRGDIQKGFQEADVIVEGHYSTQVQTHSAFETHGAVVDWKPDLMTVWASTQDLASVRQEFATFFQLPMNQVRVLTEFVGGNFGLKVGADNAGVCAAALSKKSGAPVYLMLDREEEHISGGNRPSSDQVLRIGAKKDGTLTAIQHVNYGTAGCNTGAGCGGPAAEIYKSATLRLEENDVFTNAGPALSAPSASYGQGIFALEQIIDELATKLGIDPLDLRDRIDENSVRRVERQVVRESIIWKSRNPIPAFSSGLIKRGIGVAQSTSPRNIELNSAADIRIYADGSVEVFSAVQESGDGIKTTLAQIVAEEYGIPPDQVGVRIGDTNYPFGPSSFCNMIASLTPAVRDAAWQAKLKFLADIAPTYGTTAEDLELINGEVRSISRKMHLASLRDAASRMSSSEICVRVQRIPDYDPNKFEPSGSVIVAEINVDIEVGRVHVERVLVVQDCGRPINPLQIKSQIAGSVIQGLSYTMFENRQLDPSTGHMVNANFDMYKLAGSRETPDIQIDLIESYTGQSSTDASEIGGRDCMMAIGPAIANAFYNATGRRIRRTPMLPSQVLATLNETASEGIAV
jgi:xanthine dehydrogenase YagR molybdenum-binding subunit